MTARVAERYLDGEWHRLHPATPLLRGGIGFVAIAGWVLAQFRERAVQWLVGGFDDTGDPIDEIVRHRIVFQVALGVGAILLIGVGLFWIAWRTSTFRVGDGSVTVRRGVLIRTTRTARLDRIQGVTIGRPFFARLMGAARIELDVAGHDANVRLEYLSSAQAETFRRDVLRLASGARATGVAGSDGSGADGEAEAIARDDWTPEPGTPVLAITPWRAVGSSVFHEGTVWFVLFMAAFIAGMSALGGIPALLSAVPILIGYLTVTARRVGRNLRYTIVGTTDGVRVGAGILSTSNELLPPGRVHAVRIEQPLMWRPLGWWRVSVNRAGRIQGRGNADLERTIAPVATRAEVEALVPRLVPGLEGKAGLLQLGLVGAGDDGFVTAPRRGRWLRPLSWHRTGFAVETSVVLFRGGWFRRHLMLVPQARMQSIAVRQGPLQWLLGVTTVEVHTVAGPVRPDLGLVDRDRAVALFGELAQAGQHARAEDRSHRWAEGPDVG